MGLTPKSKGANPYVLASVGKLNGLAAMVHQMLNSYILTHKEAPKLVSFRTYLHSSISVIFGDAQYLVIVVCRLVFWG